MEFMPKILNVFSLAQPSESDTLSKHPEVETVENVKITEESNSEQNILTHNQYIPLSQIVSENDTSEKGNFSKDFLKNAFDPGHHKGPSVHTELSTQNLSIPQNSLIKKQLSSPISDLSLDQNRPRTVKTKFSPQHYAEIFNKSEECINKMLEKENHANFFKCPGSKCSYSSNCQQDFINHFETCTNEPHLICCYCFEVWDRTRYIDYVSHILHKHGLCKYQCTECFYRASYELYIKFHFEWAHENEDWSKYMLCEVLPSASEEVESRTVFPSYKCNIANCKFSSSQIDTFISHSHLEHKSVTKFQCCYCESYFFKATLLVSHYALHQIHPLHCCFCPYGSKTLWTLLCHLSIQHPDRQPKIFFRHPLFATNFYKMIQSWCKV